MALSIQERVYQKIKQLSDKQLQEVLLFIEFLSLREDKEFKEKLKGTEIAQSKDAKKSFSLEFTELSDKELEKKLKAFEKKYQIDSETLYQLYQKGKAPEWISDRILWAGLYRLKKDENDVE